MGDVVYYDLFFSAKNLSLVKEEKEEKFWDRTEDPDGDPYNKILSGKGASDWVIVICRLENELLSYDSGRLVLEISLTEQESKSLTLGTSKEDGGDFTQDREFGMDIETFFDTYRNIPERVKKILKNLPGDGDRSRRRWRSSSEIGLEVF